MARVARPALEFRAKSPHLSRAASVARRVGERQWNPTLGSEMQRLFRLAFPHDSKLGHYAWLRYCSADVIYLMRKGNIKEQT